MGGVIQLAPAQLDPDQRFEDLGVDSIVVNDVNARLEQEVGPLPKTLLFEHPNLRRLAGHLAAHHAAAFARVAGPDAPASPAGPVVAVEPVTAPAPAALAVDGDIAIIGLAGRYPGAESLEDFWRLLREGREAVTEVPPERWDVDAFHDPDPARAIDDPTRSIHTALMSPKGDTTVTSTFGYLWRFDKRAIQLNLVINNLLNSRAIYWTTSTNGTATTALRPRDGNYNSPARETVPVGFGMKQPINFNVSASWRM